MLAGVSEATGRSALSSGSSPRPGPPCWPHTNSALPQLVSKPSSLPQARHRARPTHSARHVPFFKSGSYYSGSTALDCHDSSEPEPAHWSRLAERPRGVRLASLSLESPLFVQLRRWLVLPSLRCQSPREIDRRPTDVRVIQSDYPTSLTYLACLAMMALEARGSRKREATNAQAEDSGIGARVRSVERTPWLERQALAPCEHQLSQRHPG